MKDLNFITKDYIVSLQKYINDVEKGRQIKQNDFKYSYELEILFRRCKDIQSTSKLSCFNGTYDINQDSFDYYMKKLSNKYNLKLKKDDYFPNDWIINNGNSKQKCQFGIIDTSQKIKGVNTNHIVIELIGYSAQMILYSFSELDRTLEEIFSGWLFKHYKFVD